MDVADAVGHSSLTIDGVPERTYISHFVTIGLPQPDEKAFEKDNMQRRLQTFANWVGAALPIQLAIAGFVFLSFGDEVQCENCKVRVGNWKKGDIPLDVHRKHSPDCSFIQKWFPQTKQSSSYLSGDIFNLGYDITKAKYQAFVALAKRLATFDAWPLKLDVHSPTNMSMAGFFYIGSADRVKCFYCGLALRDWDTDNDPFEAHSQWSSKCAYILHIQRERNRDRGNESKSEENTDISAIMDTMTIIDTSDVVSSSAAWKSSTQVETVLAMGFPEKVIQEAIALRRETEGDEFPDAVSLFCAVEAMVEKY